MNQKAKTVIGKSRSGFYSFKVMTLVGWVVFGLITLIVLLDSSFSFGRSIGWKGLGVILGSVLFSVFSCGFIWTIIFGRSFWSLRKCVFFFFVVFVSGAALDASLLTYADQRWGIGDLLVDGKIEYFCLKHFDQRECVRNVNLCPRCALSFDKWQRDIMVENLKPYRNQYPAAVRAEIERSEKVHRAAASVSK